MEQGKFIGSFGMARVGRLPQPTKRLVDRNEIQVAKEATSKEELRIAIADGRERLKQRDGRIPITSGDGLPSAI